MSDTTQTPVMENPAQTMRDVILEHARETPISNPREDEENATAFNTPALIAIPEKRRIEDLTSHYRDAKQYLKPARRKGTARLSDLNSIIAWANRFKGETSALFAQPSMTAPTLTCIADYHGEGPVDATSPTGDPSARHCHHRAIYDFPLSDEWKAWMAISGEALGKDEMGDFIEAQAKDIMDPTPPVLANKESDKNANWENRLIQTAQQIEGRYGQLGQLLAMSKRFQVFETSDLVVRTNRDSGEAEVVFLNEHKTPDGKPLDIPNLIIVAIPVFQGGAPYRMPVRFRYRKSGAKISFILTVYNPEKAFEAAFNEAIEEATEKTDLPTFMGSPES